MTEEVKREQSQEELRDLHADLALTERATDGEWVERNGKIINRSSDDQTNGIKIPSTLDDERFIAESREGWPHAIRRAIAAEAEVERVKTQLRITLAQNKSDD